MNIHEHQAKELLADFGAPISNGVVIYKLNEIEDKINKLNTKNFVLKAQIHAGGRGKAGGVKLIKSIDELKSEAKKLLGKKLVTPQTGPEGKTVQRLYIEEASDISKEYYLSCLVDRQSSKIAFISSREGGMDIEKVALENPKKIITTKVEYSQKLLDEDIKKVLELYSQSKENGILVYEPRKIEIISFASILIYLRNKYAFIWIFLS